MVSQRATDRRIRAELLAYAQRTEDSSLYERILALGEPPHRDTPWTNSLILSHHGLIEPSYDPPAVYLERAEASGLGPFGLFGSEYTFIENANLIRGLVDMLSLMHPQLQDIDFRADVPALEVPVYLLDGANELRGRRELAHEWFASLRAPHKELIPFEHAGPAVAFEQVDALRDLFRDRIVRATRQGHGGWQG